MRTENVTYAFQNAATTGVGVTQFWLERANLSIAVMLKTEAQGRIVLRGALRPC
jgi:hypothetical protein